MKQALLISVFVCVFGLFTKPALAASKSLAKPTPTATVSAVIDPTVVPTVTPATSTNLTQTQPSLTKSKLEQALDSHQIGALSPTNFLQVAIRHAVDQGVPANTIVLLILFPLVAAIIAFARHVIGMQGFGIFTPAVVSVAFLSTGVVSGVLIFIGILLVATVGRMILKRLRIPTMPRMALLLWFVSLGILGFLLASPWLNTQGLMTLNIFPILLLVLLAETFIDAQITRTFQTALYMTLETLFLALIAFFVLSLQRLQVWVLINPEMAVIGIALTDFLIGRYSGLRVLEYWRFRKLINS